MNTTGVGVAATSSCAQKSAQDGLTRRIIGYPRPRSVRVKQARVHCQFVPGTFRVYGRLLGTYGRSNFFLLTSTVEWRITRRDVLSCDRAWHREEICQPGTERKPLCPKSPS